MVFRIWRAVNPPYHDAKIQKIMPDSKFSELLFRVYFLCWQRNTLSPSTLRRRVCHTTALWLPRSRPFVIDIRTIGYQENSDIKTTNENSMESQQYPSEVNVLSKRVNQLREGRQLFPVGRVNFFRMDWQMLKNKSWEESARTCSLCMQRTIFRKRHRP